MTIPGRLAPNGAWAIEEIAGRNRHADREFGLWFGVWIGGGRIRHRGRKVRADRAGRSMNSGTTPDFVGHSNRLESVWGVTALASSNLAPSVRPARDRQHWTRAPASARLRRDRDSAAELVGGRWPDAATGR